LQHSRADIDINCLPDDSSDLGQCLTHAPEAFVDPDKVDRPLTCEQTAELRKNRHCYTAGEDNLILRGVNLYGEKEWCLVSDRFLPDRVVNSISQRYNKLCFLIYRANGIKIDEQGKLVPIPTFSKGSSYDVLRSVNIRPARSPTTMNVHRWTLEEDVAILRAVPVMGKSWTHICSKLMPHRDRGHIRKRYQVLQRRIPKGVTQISMKYLLRTEGYVYSPPRPSPWPHCYHGHIRKQYEVLERRIPKGITQEGHENLPRSPKRAKMLCSPAEERSEKECRLPKISPVSDSGQATPSHFIKESVIK